MNSHIPPALASIVVPCFNQVEFTQRCVQALFRHSRRPWELIVVDNGSTDGTGHYLDGVRDAASTPVTVIKNAENRGFPAAINQGLQQARGEYLVLLNNDAVVTDGWLDQLIALTAMRAESDTGELRSGLWRRIRVPETRPTRCGVVLSPKKGTGTRPRSMVRAKVPFRAGREPVPVFRPRLADPRRAGSAWSGRCRITRRRRNWSRMCRIAISTRCTNSPGDGAMSTGENGSRCPSYRGFACS